MNTSTSINTIRRFASLFLWPILMAAPIAAQTTNTNTVTNGGIINVGDTQIITNPVASPISAAITNDGSLQFWQTTAMTVSGVISGTGTVTKAAGSGNLTLSGSNIFNGNVFSSGGILIATSVSDTVGSGLGLGSRVELGGSSAQLQMNIDAGTTNTTSRQLVVTTSFTFANYRNGSIVWNGNLVNNATSAVSMSFNGTSTATNVFGGTIANSTNGSALNLTLNNTGNWRLDGTNTYSGGTTIAGGKLIVSSLATNGSIGSGNFRMGGFSDVPVLEYVGSGDTNNKRMKLGAGSAATGGRILNNGTGALVFTNANFIIGADVLTAGLNRAVTFGGTNTADNAITGVIANVNATNTVSVVKADSGKWILSGSNTYTGGTTVSAGSLIINGNNSAATGVLSVAQGATLGGSGTIGGAATISGTLAPGNSPGDLTFNDSLLLTSTATLSIEITGINIGEFDRVVGDGSNTFTFDGTLSLDNTGYTATLGDTITIFSNWGSFAGAFDTITGTDLGGGLSWDTSNLGTTGAIEVVPEPSTYALLGLAALALGARVLRRRRQHR